MSYKIVQASANRRKFEKKCEGCQKKFKVYVTLAQEPRVSCLECQSCHHLVWHQYEIDPFWRDNAQLMPDQIENKIEGQVPPCPKCKGRLRYIPWADYGAPVHCLYCGRDQRVSDDSIDPELTETTQVRVTLDSLKYVDTPQ